MNTGWRGKRWRWLAAGALAMTAGGWLVAQDARGTASQPTGPAPTSQPAAATPTSQPTTQPAPDAGQQTARELLMSGLVGSRHDFTHGGLSGRDLCLPCHTPHLMAAPPPEWDRRPATPAPLRPYETRGIELDGWSLLCLGCHDGVTARDVFRSPHAVTVGEQLGQYGLGTRGLRSHPVGIKYPEHDEHYQSVVAVEADGLMMPDGRIQCATCHDAHNTQRHQGMLRVSNQGSRLCLTCHRL